MKKYTLVKIDDCTRGSYYLRLLADRFDFWQWAKNRVIAFNFKCKNGAIKPTA